MKSLLIAAGHSNVDPGAVFQPIKDAKGRILVKGEKEADIAVEFRNIVSFYLTRDYMVPHDLDGRGSQNMPLVESIRLAKLHDQAIEFHCNASVNALANGTEALSGLEDKNLASRLSATLAGVLELKNRGWKPESASARGKLGFVRAGGIIVELLFITNREDVRKYHAKKWLAGKAVAEVLARWADSR